MKNDNKGFSLIELIVVIAIMAILVGAIAPQVIKYIESANEAQDQQTLASVYTAVTTAIADLSIEGTTIEDWSGGQTLSAATGNLANRVKDILGVSALSDVKMKSKKGKNGGVGAIVKVTIGLNSSVTVEAGTMNVTSAGYADDPSGT